jgi:lipoprotein-releasing system ATP-binding protein
LSADPAPRIRLQGVRRSFESHGQQVPVLSGIDLDVAPGASVLVRGASGAGKSTLLCIAALIDDDYEGVLEFADQDARKAGDEDRRSWRLERIGVAFQDLHLVPTLTALENVALPIVATGVLETDARGRAMSLLDEAGVAHRANERPGALSGGERRRVAVVRALANAPGALILDEPTAELDDASAQAVIGLIQKAKAAGTSLLIASHDARLAQLCETQLELRDGVLVPLPRAAAA